MTDSFRNIEDEPFPSFLSASLSSSHATLGNLTLGSTLGVPVAASTVAKIRAGVDNRASDIQASYLEGGQLFHSNSQSSNDNMDKFAISLKDEMDDADDFIAAHRFSDMLVNVHLDEAESVTGHGSPHMSSALWPSTQPGPPNGRSSDHGNDLSTGLITFSHLGNKETLGFKAAAPLPVTLEEENPTSDGADSDGFSGSVSSFLANEKLVSLDSMYSDASDDDGNRLQDDELELYFNKLVPPAMQRGQVEGQEIPAVALTGNQDNSCYPSSTEQETNRYQFLDDFDQEDFQMPHVRLAATGMDSCPASDEDTEDEEEPVRRQSASRARFLLPSTSRLLVGESNRLSFRPGLEGGSSDDEQPAIGRHVPPNSGMEFRRSAEGQVINTPVTGDGGGGGDGSSGSEEMGAGGVPVTPIPPNNGQTAYDAMRGLAIVGGSGGGVGQDQEEFADRPGLSEMGDRVGPVGTGEAGSADTSSRFPRASPVNWSMTLDRQEALDAMDNTESALGRDGLLDSLYLRNGAAHGKPPDTSSSLLLQGTQSSFHLSQVLHAQDVEGHAGALGLRGGPCGFSTVPEPSDSHSEGEPCDVALEAKYLSRSFQGEDSADDWNHCPDNLELEFQQGANATHNVVYQNEEGKWVTDLAYYSSFEKEPHLTEVAEQFQSEDFVSGSNAIEKITEDQEEFEKEHQFIQEEQVVAQQNTSLGLGDTSWRLPTSNHILMRASQVSSEFERGDPSYLRLSLGEFFQQRSEALGCLGDYEEDNIKRPSFGYVITSPEKREPFALIRPSDFCSRESPVLSDTVHLSDADKTMNPEDLEKTLEETESMGSKNDVNLESAGEDLKASENRSADSPNSSNDLMLSISTIASAIADASVSSDPTQLAAMIMELSKKNRLRQAGAMPGPALGNEAQNSFLEALQKSTSTGELSAFDIEKYLKRTELSSSNGDPSVSPYSFNFEATCPLSGCDSAGATDSGALHRHQERSADACQSPSGVSRDDRSVPKVGSGGKCEVRRSSIPRPKSRCIPAASANPNRRSSAAAVSPAGALKPTLEVRPGSPCVDPEAAASGGAGAGVKLGKVRPILSSAGTSSHPALGSLKTGEPTPAAATSPTTWGPHSALSSLESPATGAQTCPGWMSEKASAVANGQAGGSLPAEKHVGFDARSPVPTARSKDAVKGFSPESAAPGVEETQCTFRPSTSPLTHSSPSQSSIPSTDGMAASPASSGGGAERRPQDSFSPQSHCSSPSLSRLTYISLNDSTLLNSTCLPTPDMNKSNSSLALSTTIVRASPTPPVAPEHENHPSDPGAQDLQYPKMSPGFPNEAQNTESRQGSDQDAARSQSECNFRAASKSQVPSAGTRVRHSEPGPQHPGHGDSGYSSNLNIQQPGSADQAPGPWSGVSNQREPYPRSGSGLLPSFASKDLRYMPLSSFRPGGAVPDLPPAIPTLLTDRSLFASQLAQQYLGTDVSLRAYHAGATGLYGADSSLGRMPGPVPLATSGLPCGYLPRSHQLPMDSGLLGANKPYGRHELESLSMWVAGGLTEQAQVVVPEELKFPSTCCVGIASQTSLSTFNPTERWLQVGIAVTGLSIDGEKIDSLPYQWLMVKNKTIIGPKTTEEQKVLFIPPRAGVYKCVISVSSWPSSAQSEAMARAEVFAKRVILIAVAENPSIEVEAGTSGCLDFGDLTGGSAKALPLRLINRTQATVPIRLVISANATAWRCFTFSKSSVAMPMEGMLQPGTVTPLAAQSVMNHVMHASYGDKPESFMVWVHFNAPQKYASSSGDLGPADEYSARVDIEVDSPGPSQVVQSVPLRARSGTARVHAPKDMQTVYLMAPFGKSSQQTLPLKNAGNIDVQLKLTCIDGEGCFSVKPEDCFVRAGAEQGVVVTFNAQGSRKYRETMLTILVLPSGPQYEVMLKGEAKPADPGKRSSPVKGQPSDGVTSGEVPPILSNKQFMSWGGVTLGRAVQQKLVLRNNSPNSVQQLRLLIRGQDQDCFQLQSTFGPEERLTRHREISMRPKEDVAVHLLFAPTRVACMLAKLEIKQSGARSSQPGIKFTIPLSGYGGTSNIILEDVKKLSDSYVVTLNGVSAGRVSKVCLCVRNTGSRAAFLKAVPYSDLATRALMDPSVISVSPSQFVLKERTQEVITVLLKCTRREQGLCQSSSALLATVCFFCGDELSRQGFRRLLRSKPEVGKKLLSENSLLKNLNFNERFLGEERVTEAYDLPQRPNEAQLFYSNMNKVVLSVLGSVETSDSGESDCPESVRPALRRGSESDSGLGNSDRHISNVSLDVLPVKGPQGPSLALHVADPASLKEPSNPQDSWSIQPEQLVLTAPTISGAADTRHVRIQNHSPRELTFELSWPAHCLTITPQHGTIEPECHLQILISPNPSLATKSSMLPWSGQIYVQCDNQQKFIKVQIRQDLTLDVSATVSTPKPLSALPPQAETPVLPGCRSAEKPPSAQVEVKNRTLVFPPTLSGDTSESFLEVENNGEEVRWYLSSFAPPYVKGVDSSEDVYRATYTAFRCSRVSGMLGVKENMKVPITFLPRDGGDYAQFWDLECHPVAEPHQKSRVRFQLCGTGFKAGAAASPRAGDSTLVRTETTAKARKRSEAPAQKPGQEEAPRRGVYAPQDQYAFPQTRAGEFSSLKVNVRNNSPDTHELKFISPREPFHIKHSRYSLRSQHYINLPVQFKPAAAGRYCCLLLIQTDTQGSLTIRLTGEAVP